MKNEQTRNHEKNGVILLLGGTGKIGRRVAKKLASDGVAIRVASRSTSPSFDWNDSSTWDEALEGVMTAYLSYAPDLAIPGATDSIRAFVDKAAANGVGRLVLLSGRGEEEAQACERIVQESGVEWTIVRASWFMQNFSEGEFLGMVQGGAITLPARNVPEPFIDVNDIADVVVAALTEDGHGGEVYEVTGPRLMTFRELALELSSAAGREIPFVEISGEAFADAIVDSGAPNDIAWLLNYLFDTVLDGRNAYLSDGVQRALGREPADFSDFARRAAATGVWELPNADEEVAA